MPFACRTLAALSSILFIQLALLSAEPQLQKVVAGYYPEWGVYGRNYHITNVPAALLTHLNYAFLKPVFEPENDRAGIELADPTAAIERLYPGDSQDQPFHGNLNQLLKLKDRFPHLKTLLSVGGASYSTNFSDIAASSQARETFAESCVQHMVQYGFDGIDIDWEFPVQGGSSGVKHRNTDAANHVLLMGALRSRIEQQEALESRDYLLTLAASITKDTLTNRYNLKELGTHVDWINFMAYGMTGAWAPVTSHEAPLHRSPNTPYENYNVADSSAYLVHLDIPREKIVMGVPFYGFGFKGVTPSANGLFQTHQGLTDFGTWSPGLFTYRDLRDGSGGHQYIGSGGYSELWDASAHAPFLFNAETGIWITYENPRSLLLKASYVNERQFRGMMSWSLDADSSTHELQRAMYEGILKTGAGAEPPGTPVCKIDFDTFSAGWNYSYTYAGFGGTGFSERIVDPSTLPTSYNEESPVGAGGSQALEAFGDFTAIPSVGSTNTDGFPVEWHYSGLGMGSGMSGLGQTNFISPVLSDYTLSFASVATAGILPTKSATRGVWKLQIQAPDDTLSPPDSGSESDTIIALQGDFFTPTEEMTTFLFRLGEAQIVTGSEAAFLQYFSNLTQINLNFNFGEISPDFGLISNASIAVDEILLFCASSGLTPPLLTFSRSQGQLQLRWAGAGILQESSSLEGPFLPVQSAQAPYTIQADKNSAFYRIALP